VRPESIPDYLALVGDSADGYPGLRGWGAKSTATVLAKFGHIEAIPRDYLEWHVNVAGVSTLAATLFRDLDLALLFRRLATLRTDIELFQDIDELLWQGPKPEFEEIGRLLDEAVTQKSALSRASRGRGPSA
jgi:5'-3' exonuclease